MIEVVDDAGRTVVLQDAARRIVSLVPSLTEAVCALGRSDALVGITRYCTEPAEVVSGIERVGGTKNPDHARIKAVQPDLVLVNAEENRREDFEALEQAGHTLFVSFPRRAPAIVDLVTRIGELIGGAPAAQRMASHLRRVLVDVEDELPGSRPRVCCPIWKNPWMSLNRDTYGDDLLRRAGGDNVCADRAERYCTVTLEEIASADPEVILLPDEPYVFATKDLPALAALSATSASRSGRIHFIDGKALSWYGPRTAAALRFLREVLGSSGGASA